MWGNISEAQQNAWLPVMQATLSTEGYNRVMADLDRRHARRPAVAQVAPTPAWVAASAVAAEGWH